MRKQVLSVSVYLALFCGISAAQSETATLSGHILDQSGAAVPGVEVKVVQIDTGVERVTSTNNEGIYVMPNLRPGRYRIVARKDGFRQVIKTDVVLHVQDIAAENFTLAVGAVSESTTVVASAVNVETSPAVTQTIDGGLVSQLPLNGRTIQALIALTPGTLTITSGAFPNGANEGQISVNGLRTTQNYMTVDGVSANLFVSASGAASGASNGTIPGWSQLGVTSNIVSIDALQEFKVQTSSYSAEFGRTPGAQIQLTTKSGTNAWHGTVFEYLRNDKMDAADWFVANKGLTKPPLRDNNFGGTFSGPIWKNKTFFFFSYEGLRLRLPQTTVSTVPSVVARTTAAAALKPYYSIFPAPTGPDAANGLSAPFAVSYSNPQKQDATSIRIDHTVNRRIAIFGRYDHSPSATDSLLPTASASFHNYGLLKTVTAGANFVISSAITNELRYNWSQNLIFGQRPFVSFSGTTLPSADLLRPAPLTANSAFAISLPGGAFSVTPGSLGERRQVNITDGLSWLKGSHFVKFGFDYRNSPVFQNTTDKSMTYSFTTLAAVQTGIANTLSLTNNLVPNNSFRWSAIGLFAQDTWRVNKRLTLDYGLRWDINPPPDIGQKTPFVEVDGVNPVHFADPKKPLFPTLLDAFGPRIGFAYWLMNRDGHELVLRGGYGRFYDVASGSFGSVGQTYFPLSATQQLTNVAFPAPASIAFPTPNPTPPYSTSFGSFIAVYDKDFAIPRVHQWNLAIEQGFGSTQKLTVTYTGNAGRRLMRISTLSPVRSLYPIPSPDFNGPTTVINVNTNREGNSDSSDYHALQMQFRRQSKRVNAIVNYTYAHAIDTGSASNNVNGPSVFTYNVDQDRGNSAFDRRHIFNAAVTWDLPSVEANGDFARFLHQVTRDWSFDTIFRAESSAPMDALLSFSRDANGGSANFFTPSTLRPDLVSGVPLYVTAAGTPGGKIPNFNAFAVPGILGQQGTMPRNKLRGLPMWQPNIAIGRRFPINERIAVQFKGEVFNVFNHPNFAPWSPNWATINTAGQFVPSTTWGTTTMLNNTQIGNGIGLSSLFQVGGPRSVQLSMRLSF